jgi:hypothetical protein
MGFGGILSGSKELAEGWDVCENCKENKRI